MKPAGPRPSASRATGATRVDPPASCRAHGNESIAHSSSSERRPRWLCPSPENGTAAIHPVGQEASCAPSGSVSWSVSRLRATRLGAESGLAGSRSARGHHDWRGRDPGSAAAERGRRTRRLRPARSCDRLEVQRRSFGRPSLAGGRERRRPTRSCTTRSRRCTRSSKERVSSSPAEHWSLLRPFRTTVDRPSDHRAELLRQGPSSAERGARWAPGTLSSFRLTPLMDSSRSARSASSTH